MFGKFPLILLLAAFAVGLVACTSHGAGQRAYVVKLTDTLWAIAARTYAGDVVRVSEARAAEPPRRRRSARSAADFAGRLVDADWIRT
jgi:hypothetical protein